MSQPAMSNDTPYGRTLLNSDVQQERPRRTKSQRAAIAKTTNPY